MAPANKRTSVTCEQCDVTLVIPPDSGVSTHWVRRQGWTIGGAGSNLDMVRCPDHARRLNPAKPKPRSTRKPTEATAEDVAYRERIAERRRQEEALLAEMFAQRHARKPRQPAVDAAPARKSLAYYGQSHFGKH